MPVISLSRNGRELEKVYLNQGSVTIGRDERTRIHLPDDDVSSRHARIDIEGEECRFTDLSSTNGSLLNGESCSTATLNDGDTIRIGDYTLAYSDAIDARDRYFGSERTMAVNLQEEFAARGISEPAAPAPPSLSANAVLESIFPAISWLRGYSQADLKQDFQAGITIAVLLIPQGMAYALLAGLPSINGLYASILPLIIYAFSGTSRQLSVAPVALDSLLLASGIGVMAQAGTDAYIQLAILVTLMIGGIQLLMGILRLGFVVNFLSKPVLTGFTMAAAIIIAVSQMKNLLGLEIPRSTNFFTNLANTFSSLLQLHPWTSAVGILGVMFLYFFKRLKAPLPGPVVLLVAGTLVSWLLGFERQGVAVVGQVPSGLPSLQLIVPSSEQFVSLLPLAFTLACIGFMGALSVGKNYASRFGYRIKPNTEFRALGLSNIGASLSGGFNVTGGMSRTAVNVNAGARTQVSSIISAIAVLISVAFLTPVFYHVPIPLLAAIIVISIVGLLDINEVKYLLSVKPIEIIVLGITFFTTLLFGFSTGLLAGLLAALIVHIIIQTKPNATLLGRLPKTSIFRSLEKHPEAEPIPGITILRIDASFYFANAEFLQQTIAELVEKDPPPKIIILDASAINDLDSSGDSAFRDIYRELGRRNIRLYIAGVKSPVREVLMRSGLYDEIGAEYFFYSVEAAITRIESSSRTS